MGKRKRIKKEEAVLIVTTRVVTEAEKRLGVRSYAEVIKTTLVEEEFWCYEKHLLQLDRRKGFKVDAKLFREGIAFTNSLKEKREETKEEKFSRKWEELKREFLKMK